MHCASAGILLDSGSDEQVCPEDCCNEGELSSEGLGSIRLRGVQGKQIKQLGKPCEGCRYMGDDGFCVKSDSEFVVTLGLREPVLNAGKLVKSCGVIHLDAEGAECNSDLVKCPWS